MVAADVYAGISSFKVILDTAKSLMDMNDASARKTAVIELQEKIVTAQQTQSALIQQVGQLEAEVTAFKNWDTEKQRYELTDYGSGTFAYALKKEKANGEPSHRICANCFNQGHKSLLQFRSMTHDNRECLIWQRCGKESYLGSAQKAPRLRFEGGGGDGSSWMAR